MRHAPWAVALACAATAVAHAGARAPERAAVPCAAALETLEQALDAHPDDLRAGNDYRMAVIQANQYDRAIAFFEKLVTAHPDAGNAHLNYGFAYVDKIPAAGAITQVILANNALREFTKSIELHPTWIGYYTRGNSYLFWPRIFNRTQLGIDDLKHALEMQQAGPKRPYHVRVFVALGDGYWKLDQFKEATDTWRAGLAAFPDSGPLKKRLAAGPDELGALVDAAYDPAVRVDTSLQDLWTSQ